MTLERVKRWQWIVLSVVVGLALAYARRADLDNLPSRLGEGVADRQWFEQQVRRTVPLADGSTVPAFSRLTVYPLTIQERGGTRPVHVVAGMHLTEINAGTGPASALAVGKIRPRFFIAPVPYTSPADPRAGKPEQTYASVTEYLDTLRGDGVTYAYAWWVDPRYATAAWVAGSVLVIGLLWPTALNLLVYGRLFAPPSEKGASLWKVKSTRPGSRHGQPTPVNVPVGMAVPTDLPAPGDASGRTPPADAPAPHFPERPAPLALSAAEDHPQASPSDPHKEFGAQRDDFYPTELKASTRTTV